MTARQSSLPKPSTDGVTPGSTIEDTSPSARAFLHALAHVSDITPAPPEPASAQTLGLPGDARFLLRRRLGSGGFGTVYEALDRTAGAVVALKVMRRRDAHALYLFKQEFRALAGMAHPRLVQLYELHADDDRWFYTMELVRGTDVLHFLRADPPASLPFDEARLRSTFAQLAEGLAFLHERGKLHRDIKPSNVMVDAEGNVKILDFGLVTEIEGGEGGGLVVGTPRYMAPEQARGEPVGPAADWYAVGVVLHEALTGELPPPGAPPLGARWPGVPADLARLCMDLLAPDPGDRPDGRAVSAALGPKAALVEVQRGAFPAQPFVGRAAELEALGAALAEARAGHAVVALVHGPSGIGKSTLVTRFLEAIAVDPTAAPLALAGRCFAQESVPHKALDNLIDALCRKLAAMPDAARAPLLPEDVGILARLFPVLRRIPGVEASRRRDEGKGAPDLRVRAAFALRTLLSRMAQGGPSVLFVDDLQWGDLDSVGLLLDLLRAPGAPLLLVVTYRSEEAATSHVLRAFLEGVEGEAGADLRTRDVPVGELDGAAAEALAEALLASSAPARRRREARAVAAEGRGHPLFITEHARAVGLEAPATVGLDALLGARIEGLAPPVRRLLEVTVVAGQPIARPTAARAAHLEDGPMPEPQVLTLLCAGQLLRVQRAHDREEILPYHDRIGAAVAARLGPEIRRQHHAALALALEGADAEAEQLFYHLRESGQPERAVRHAIRAADQAMEALAFDRAARLYHEALALGVKDEAEARVLAVRRADALAYAGRPRESAQAYLEAARHEPPARALSLRQKAMEQLLSGGYLDEGLAVLERVLGELGIPHPTTKLGALALLVKQRARLALRGLSPRERPAEAIPERTLLAVDACRAAAETLALADPLRGAALQAEHLVRALEAGDPLRLSRALRLEAAASAFFGRGLRAAEDLFARAEALAQRAAFPEEGPALLARCMTAQMRGEFARAEPLFRRGMEAIAASPAAASWQVDLVSAIHMHSLWLCGQIPELSASVPRLVAEARERGNRYRETMLRLTSEVLVMLAADRPAAAEEVVRSSIARWSSEGFHLQHFRALLARARVALYAGEGRRAFGLLVAAWPKLLRTGLLLAPAIRAQAHCFRALAALAAAAEGGGRALLMLAASDARALAPCEETWARPFATLLEAVVAERRGQREAALAQGQVAEQAFAALGYELPRMAARRFRGDLLGGAEGQALVTSADEWMATRGIRRPARIAALLVGSA